MHPHENKFHAGNGEDGKHYWLTPPDLYAQLDAEFHFDFDPCPYPKPADFDGLTCEWGQRNYVNPPFGSIVHEGKKKGPTAWMRKAIEEQRKGKLSVVVYPVDKWVLMMLAATGAKNVRNLGDVKWCATEDGSQGKGTGRHIACFVLTPNSVIIQNGAGALNIDPKVFEAAIVAAASGNKKAIAESALKATSPVRADPGSSMAISGPLAVDGPAIVIPYAAVAEAPARIELEPNERVEEYKGAELTVRATNLDSRKQGWAGKLGTREERLPIELDPSVSETELFGRERVKVDAALVFKEKGHSRELKPARIYVRKVHGAAGSSVIADARRGD